MSLHNYWDKVRRHFSWNRQDWIKWLVVAIAFGFILTVQGWLTNAVTLATQLRNLLIAAALCGIALFIHHAAQRLMALYSDAEAGQEVWWNGLLIGILLSVISGGTVPFLAATGTYVKDLPLHRLGHYRYRSGTVVKMLVAVAGPIANVVTAMIALACLLWKPELWWCKDFASVSLFMAAENMLPIPPLDGTRVFFASRMGFAIIGGAIVAGLAAYLVVAQLSWWIFWSMALGALVAGVCWWYFAERDND
jgi:membrane-associated protease RseP (regulator of RpoE activity)